WTPMRGRNKLAHSHNSEANPARHPLVRGMDGAIAGDRVIGRLSAAIFLSVLAIGAPSSAVPLTLPRGDVNDDGRWDEADALALTRHLRGDAPLTPKGVFAADLAPLSTTGTIQADNRVNVSDLLVLLRVLRGDLPRPSTPTMPASLPAPDPATNILSSPLVV